MNAPVTVVMPIKPSEIDVWRGQFIGMFTRIEEAVAETSLLLMRTQKNGCGSLDQTFQQRRAKLITLLDKVKGHDVCVKNARKRLEQSADWCDLRNLVCHGTGRLVRVDGDESALWLTQPVAGSLAAFRTGVMLSSQERANLLGELRRISDAVTRTLANLRERLLSNGSPQPDSIEPEDPFDHGDAATAQDGAAAR